MGLFVFTHPRVVKTKPSVHALAVLQSLRLLDPSDILLQAVSPPVKEYLRGRKDTIRRIIASLTEDNRSEV